MHVHMAEEEAVEPAHPVLKSIVAVLCGLLVVVCLLWTLDAPLYLGVALYGEQFLAFVLGLALCAAYLSLSWRRRPHARINWLDVIVAIIGLAAGTWIAVEYPRLALEVSFRTPEILTLAGIIIVLVVEALRRTTGWTLLCIVLLFFAYALFAEHMPTELQGKPFQLKGLASYLAFDPSAVLGTPLQIGATVVIMFLWMGEVLMRCGGGDFFMDVCVALFGRSRGGPAKICTVSSAMFGIISGSAVSNVVSSGILTIPMMRRTGYSARDAGAIEAVSSTGGQLMPPVMGASAFLMAEFIEVPYAEVAIAAAVPALLFYWGLYCQVDLVAGKLNLKRLTENVPAFFKVMKEGWHLLVPIAVLLVMMFQFGTDAEVAAIWAAVSMFIVGAVRPYRGQRIRARDILGSMAATGRSSIDLFMTLAAAGFVIGILNSTGLAFALTLYLVGIAGQNILVLLVLAAFVSLILGMGMPTTAVYVLCATLVAPSLIEAGVMKMAAHMFILYFGMLSMITPPVALAAFAAANISKAGPMETGWACCRIGWSTFIIPFLFVASPALLLFGSPERIVMDFVTAWVGIHFVSAAMIGHYRRDLSPVLRVVLLVCGVAAIVPDITIAGTEMLFFSWAGVLVGGAVYLNEYLATRREGQARRVAAQAGE
jgi:TRAP transporter 4TM/12TM fusion protein